MLIGYICYGMVAVSLFIIAYTGLIADTKSRRFLITVGFVIFLPAAFVTTTDLLSRPKPIEVIPAFMLPDVDEAQIMAVHMVENERIYLLLHWDGLPYPRYFSWPWTKEMAQAIQDAIGQARDLNSPGVMMKLPFDKSLQNNESNFIHPIPTPNLDDPQKEQDLPEVFQFSHPSQDA